MNDGDQHGPVGPPRGETPEIQPESPLPPKESLPNPFATDPGSAPEQTDESARPGPPPMTAAPQYRPAPPQGQPESARPGPPPMTAAPQYTPAPPQGQPEPAAPGSPDDAPAFQDAIPTAYEGGAFELGEADIESSTPSYEDQVSTAGYEHGAVDDVPTRGAVPAQVGEAWSERGLDEPPTSPSHVGSPEELESLDADLLEVGDADLVGEDPDTIAPGYGPPPMDTAPGRAAAGEPDQTVSAQVAVPPELPKSRAAFIESVTMEAELLPDDGSIDVAAPDFQQVAAGTGEPVEGEAKGGFAISEKLLTSVTAITKLPVEEQRREQPAEERRHEEPAEERRDVDPRPYLESLERDPTDTAAIAALRRIHVAAGTSMDLVGLLLERADRVESPQQRTPLLREIAKVFIEDVKAVDQAQIVLISAFLLDPTNDETAVQLMEVTGRANLWSSLFAELGQAVAQEAQPERRGALCAWLGDWYLAAGHMAYAQPCYQQALQADPRSVRAMAGMAVIFEQTGDGANLDAALQYIPPALPPGTTADLALRVSGLYERRGNAAAAATTIEQALADHGSDAQLLDTLERLLGQQQRWPELADRLARRAEAAQEAGEEPSAVADMWRRVAQLRANEVGDRRGAEQAARAVLDLLGHDPESLDLLESLYTDDSRPPELRWVLEKKLAAIAESSRERVGILLKLARLESDEFVHPDKALELLEQAIALAPRTLEAHEQVVAIHRARQAWRELAEALERFALAERDDAARFGRLVEAGHVRVNELDEPDAAIDLYGRALQLYPNEVATLGYLAEAQLRAGKNEAAFETFKFQAKAAPDPTAQAAALVRAADVARDRLLRKQEALDLLEEAIGLDPSMTQAASSLRQQRMADGDWDGAARALEAEIAQAPAAATRGRLLIQLGELLRDGLRRELEAIEAFERAREDLGDVKEVLVPLFDLYLSQEHVGEAHSLTPTLARFVPRDDPAAAARELVRYAKVATEVGDEDAALAHFEAAVAARGDDLDALTPLVELYEKRERWEEARKTLAVIVDIQKRTQMPLSLDTMVRLGRLSRLAGRTEDARRWFQAVVEEQPDHNEALRQLAAIAEARGDARRALELLEKVSVEGDDARYAHWNRLADLAQKAKDDARYERALQGALELKSDDHRALTRLLELFSRQERWVEAVDVIQRLAATVENNPKARTKYFSAAAKIYRDKIGDLAAAADMCNKVLDEDWTNLAEFEALDRMLTNAREYTLQERVYRKMIHRVTGKAPTELEASLWHALGEIYRSRLKRFEDAADAFTVASRLEPDNAERHLILAELYTALDRPAEALARHKQLLRLQPGRIESMQAMREICSATGQYDLAFAIVSNLAARGQASQPEMEFFEQWLPKPIINAVAPLGDEEWLRHLRHPDEDPYISSVFETILALVVASRARPPKEFGLSKDTMVDLSPQGSGGVLAQQFMALVRVLGLRMPPQLHVLRNSPSILAYAVTNPVSSILGGSISQVPEPQRVFLMARHLAYYQGGRYLAVLSPSRAELTAVLLSATACVTGQDQAVPAAAQGFLKNLRSQLLRNPPLFERLGQVVKRFLDRGGKADFDRWLRGVEMTACRAGLLVVADPRVAAAALKVDTSSPAAVPTKDRLEDLLAWVVTDDYSACRKALGVTIS